MTFIHTTLIYYNKINRNNQPSPFSLAYHRMIRDTFIFQPFRYLLKASATVLSGQFLPTDVFLPYAPSQRFGTTCFYQGFTGSRQLLS